MAIETGKPCSVDAQCGDLNCKDNVCAKPAKLDRCSEAAKCEGDLVCDKDSQRCVEKDFKKSEKCQTVADCTAQEYCKAKGGSCEKGKKKGEVCDEKRDLTLGSECEKDLHCYLGKCRAACTEPGDVSVMCGIDKCYIVKKDTEATGVGFCIPEKEVPEKAAVPPPTTPPASTAPPAESTGLLAKIGMGGMSTTKITLIFGVVGVAVLAIILFAVFFIMKKRRASRTY